MDAYDEKSQTYLANKRQFNDFITNEVRRARSARERTDCGPTDATEPATAPRPTDMHDMEQTNTTLTNTMHSHPLLLLLFRSMASTSVASR